MSGSRGGGGEGRSRTSRRSNVVVPVGLDDLGDTERLLGHHEDSHEHASLVDSQSASVSYGSLGINGPPGTRASAESSMECGICMHVVAAEEVFRLRTCCHRACRACFVKHVSTAIHDASFNIRCMECPTLMDESEVIDLLRDSPEIQEKYLRPKLDHFLFTHKEATRCPAPDCQFGVLIPNRTSCPKQTCLSCNLHFCSVCRAPWHEGLTCQKFQEQSRAFTVAPDDWGKTYQRCPKCRLVQTRDIDGRCNVVQCKLCHTDFCWICGSRFNIAHYFTSRCKYFGRNPFTPCQQLLCQLLLLFLGPLVIIGFSIFLAYLFVWEVTKLAYGKAQKDFKNKSSVKRRCLVALYTIGTLMLTIVLSPLIVVITALVVFVIIYIVVPCAILRIHKIPKIPQAVRNWRNNRNYELDENNVV